MRKCSDYQKSNSDHRNCFCSKNTIQSFFCITVHECSHEIHQKWKQNSKVVCPVTDSLPLSSSSLRSRISVKTRLKTSCRLAFLLARVKSRFWLNQSLQNHFAAAVGFHWARSGRHSLNAPRAILAHISLFTIYTLGGNNDF